MMVRCSKCVWFSDNTCLVRGIKIMTPNLPRRCIYYNLVPELVVNYLAEVSKTTKLDTNTVAESEPFKNYLKRMRLIRLSEGGGGRR